MHLAFIFMVCLYLPGAARRSIVIGEAHHNKDQQTNTLTKALEVSTEAQGLLPGAWQRLPKFLRAEHRGATRHPPEFLRNESLYHLEPHRAGLRSSSVSLNAASLAKTQEFNLNFGRAIDTLQSDYPEMFTRTPDMSIFTKDVVLRDPSGLQISGINRYKSVFEALRFLRGSIMQDAEMTYRLLVQDNQVRVRWNAKIWVRDPALGIKYRKGEPAMFYVDGVSVYDMTDEGFIYLHQLENIEIGGPDADPVQVPGWRLAWGKISLMPAPAGIFLKGLEKALPDFLEADDGGYLPNGIPSN